MRPSPLLSLIPFLLLLLLHTLPSTSTSTSSSTDPNATVYDILPKFGLPPGLLPDTVTSYSLSDDGFFSVDLAAPCQVQFDYLVSYDRSVTGTLKVGSIRDLKGVQVRKFLLWLDVDEIKVDLPPSDYIYFEIGWITKKLDVGQFQTVHSCQDKAKAAADGGCGSIINPVELRKSTMEVDMLVTE